MGEHSPPLVVMAPVRVHSTMTCMFTKVTPQFPLCSYVLSQCLAAKVADLERQVRWLERQAYKKLILTLSDDLHCLAVFEMAAIMAKK